MVDVSKWKEINKQYETAFRQKSEGSKSKNFKVKFDIMEWDETHYRQGNVEEFNFQFLKELMVWKMRRGHYRPTLEPLIWKNKEPDVIKILKEAQDQVKGFKDKEWNVVDLRKATDKLSELSGVGVATASAILSIMDNRIPFMSDEATELILSQGGSKKKLTYTWSTYRTYYEGIVKLSDSLKKLDDDKDSEITPKFCEQAIFAANWLNLELPLDSSLFDGDDSSDKEEIEPPKKQKKTTRAKPKAK